MAWPSSNVNTSGMDSGADTPPRGEFLSWAQKFNQLINHFSLFMQGLATSTSAAEAREALDVPSRTGGNASGTWPITAQAVTDGVTTNTVQTISGRKTFTGGVQIGAGAATLALQVGTRGGMGDDGVFRWGQSLAGKSRGELGWDNDVAIINGPGDLSLRTAGAERVRFRENGTIYTNGNTRPSYPFNVRAWGSFNAAGTLQTGAGVGSVTRFSPGLFRVNLSEAAPHAAYAVFVNSDANSAGGRVFSSTNASLRTTSGFYISCEDFTTTPRDPVSVVSFMVMY